MGRVSLRHRLNDGLERWGGHIGYDVRPTSRSQSHGQALLAGALPYARALGPKRVLYRDETNLASARIIERAGGAFAGNTPNLERKGGVGRAYWIAL